MAPLIFASVRSKSRPALLGSFRDDSTLVAFRYEKTAQAEPPTPLPPRSTVVPNAHTQAQLHGRSLRPVPSDLSSRTTLPRGPTTPPSIITAAPAPADFVVVSPPTSLTPPQEIHPALRGTSSSPPSPSDSPTPATTIATARTRSAIINDCDNWKRDSGAPTASSATIRGDESDDYCLDDPLFDKLRECGLLVTYSQVDPSIEHSPNDTASSVYSTDDLPTTFAHDDMPDAHPQSSLSPRTHQDSHSDLRFAGETTPIESTSSPPPQIPVTPPPSRLVKSFSSRTNLSLAIARKLRKRSSSNQTTSSASSTSSSAYSALATAMSIKLSGDSSLPQRASESVGASPPAIRTTPRSTKPSPNLSPASAPAHFDLSLSAYPDTGPNFPPLSIAIPDDRLLDDDFMTNFTFSNRGSVMFGGRRAVSQPDMNQQQATPDTPVAGAGDNIDVTVPLSQPEPMGTPPNTTSAAVAITPAAVDVRSHERNSNASTGETTVDRTSQATTTAPSIRVMSADVEKDSQKVRSLYETGDAIHWEEENKLSPLGEQFEPSAGEGPELENDRVPELHPSTWASPRSTSSLSTRPETIVRREYELAGGIEDWEDVNGADVDRYGFISPRSSNSRLGTPTELKSAQFASRRRNVLVKRDASGLSSYQLSGRSPSRKVSARSLNTQNSERSIRSRRSTRSAIRQASNYLPHNRNRRWMDEAGDMLSLAPGLQDIKDAREEEISEAMKKKETERSEKWRKMAKVIKKGKDGEGMEFEFDMKNPKLIERTWKGIPDRWRASAWYSFLATSAKNRHGSATEEQITTDFHRYQTMASPDDVQIDLDVPRTINRHIMFRRRYRGGQRLLFRVLHALSLYFPDVGYVQGMASLAATLLCYFDEERCFVMLVRMWQYRGLEQLYQPGFEGLMAALKSLETDWLGDKDIAKKLTELCIDATAYGTRWYLTLFNLSIPFQAQLRVWDVFLLLGDHSERPSTSQLSKAPDTQVLGIDVVHATSAALINALGEVLLDSDFENAMKALTSWIPVKDEDLLMKVAKAEWKAHQSKKKA